MSNKLFVILSFLLMFSLVIGIAHADALRNDYNGLDFSNMKQYHREIARDTSHPNIFGFKTNIWQFTNAVLDDGDMDFKDDFWMEIEPWEYAVCARGLSTQLADDDKVTADGGGIYATAITVAAYRRVSNNNDTHLYEVTWYFQPAGETGWYYTIDARGSGVTKSIQPRKPAGQRTGDSGYVAFYDTKNYTSIILKYDDKSLSYPIVEVLDENRQT